MKITAIAGALLGIIALISLSLAGCESTVDSQEISTPEGHGEAQHAHQIVVTSPLRKDVVSTQPYVCQVHSCQHIEIRALEGGYLEKICVKEGQRSRRMS